MDWMARISQINKANIRETSTIRVYPRFKMNEPGLLPFQNILFRRQNLLSQRT